MIKYKEKYDLKDYSIIESQKEFDFSVWIPESLYVVLGRSDSVEEAVNADVHDIDFCVVKRPSGGHTVVLSPKTIVISAVYRKEGISSKEIFREMNGRIISALQDLGVENLFEKGISDISIGEKKILGSSIFKSREYMFYHAVLNYSEDVEFISKLLKHPKREPDYRNGRSHKDFVTSITSAGYTFSIQELEQKINR